MGLLAASAALSALTGCDIFFPPATLRYRMTVEVETPQGLRTGSSVIEATIHSGPGWGDASGISYELHGEAVAIDLPNGKTLFALLDAPGGSDPASYHAHLFNEALAMGASSAPPMPRLFKAWEWREERKVARQLKPSFELPQAKLPLFVTFGDIRDPKSVMLVDPNDLAARFGAGTKLRRITVQITDDPVTIQVGKRLRWLGKYPEPRLDAAYKGSFDPGKIGLAQSLSHGDFRMGTES